MDYREQCAYFVNNNNNTCCECPYRICPYDFLVKDLCIRDETKGGPSE